MKCICRHDITEHLENKERPCMVIMRYLGARSVCACTHFVPTRAKNKKQEIRMRQTIA